MLKLYSIGIQVYGALLWIAAFFQPKAQLLVSGRKGVSKYITDQKLKYPNSNWIWIHAASLGEFEQGRYLIERLKTEYPQHKIALSFYSPSGYEPRKNYDKADMVFYLPLDTPINAITTIKLLNPRLAIFIKYDFWWNHLKALQDQNIPTVFISAMIRSDQYFVKRPLGQIRSILQGVRHYYVQTDESKALLAGMNINHATVIGDSRLDSIINEIQPELPIFDELVKWKSTRQCIIYGSVHKSDIPIIRSMMDIDACHLIVPHDVDKSSISLFDSAFRDAVLYSDQGFVFDHNVILDKTGLLRYIYQYTDIVYIGGGFSSGIHNILEPLVHIKPILIGPNYNKFPEAIELVSVDVIQTINTAKEALKGTKAALAKDNKLRALNQNLYIAKHSGATDIILRSLYDNRWI